MIGALLGCGKPENPNDYPVSHWLKDGEECTRASAAAIIKSGLPFPHFGTEDVPAPAGQTPKKRITTIDMWVGTTRFVIPAAVAVAGKGYARTHPRQYQGLQGSLPHFFPVGEPASVKDGMAAMVDVQISCSMEPSFVSQWGNGPRSNEESMKATAAKYERDLLLLPDHPGQVTTSVREDLEMTEVLMERRKDGQRVYWEATYWPMTGELRGPDGTVVGIHCATRHDGALARYGNRGWTCGSGISVTPNVVANVEIYVAHLQHMPTVFEQVKQLLMTVKQPSGN